MSRSEQTGSVNVRPDLLAEAGPRRRLGKRPDVSLKLCSAFIRGAHV
jgi:hypothetical protein